METTKGFASFVVGTNFGSFPEETVTCAKELTLRCLGAMLAGVKQPVSTIVIKHVKELGGTQEAGVIGAGFRTSAVNAAFIGGVTGHAVELEDNSFPGASSTLTIVPVVFALGDKLKLSGKEILESFVLGFEIQGKLASFSPGITGRGVSGIATYGSIGAAAAAAKMLRLNVEQTNAALGISASQAFGLMSATVGHMTHYFQTGAACRNGVTAALLAEKGLSSAENILEMSEGWCDLLCEKGRYDPVAMVENLGNPYHIHYVTLKQYPCCFLAHKLIDGTLEIIGQHNLSHEQIDSVEAVVDPRTVKLLRYPEPNDEDEARFSLQHNIAIAILERKVDLQAPTKERIIDPRVSELRKRIRVTMSEKPGVQRGLDLSTHQLIIKVKDGTEFRKDCVDVRGSPKAPLSREEILLTFREMARVTLGGTDIKQVEELVMDLENLSDISKLMNLLVG